MSGERSINCRWCCHQKKEWPSWKLAKLDPLTTWWNWTWLPKCFHPSKCEKYSKTPQERRHPWRKTCQQQQKNQKLQWVDWIFHFEQDFCSVFGCSMIFVQSQGRPFGSSRPFSSFGSGCAGTRASGARTSWSRGGWGENLNFPWWWEHPPVTKWIF